jgi:bleomycin hydrolase
MPERSRKRRRVSKENYISDVAEDTLNEWTSEFNADPKNLMIKNAIISVGSGNIAIDSDESRKVNHLFMNTLKKHNLKATNQGHSGRCWMFSGLNTFRHLLIKALNLENFEFSETYLFFYDKLERCNYALQWFIDHPEYNIYSREVEFMISSYMSDGGYWHSFTNLIEKYGVIPKEAMPETWQSQDSEDLNAEILYKLFACANWIYRNHSKKTMDQMMKQKETTMKQIHSILIKFLGEPPKEFVWYYRTDGGEEGENSTHALQSTPKDFTEMCLSGIDMSDFVVLGNFPMERCQERKKYEVGYTSNMTDGVNTSFINLPIYELKKYVKKSILQGLPVWFSADVSHGFNYSSSSLNNKLCKTDLLFGESLPFSKGDRVDFGVSNGNHAMLLLGVNLDEKENPIAWQVENSWGFADNHERGSDGFLSMSDEWFDENVFQVAVHRKFLSRGLQKIVDEPAQYLNPWDSMAPALKVRPMDAPRNYLQKMRGYKYVN